MRAIFIIYIISFSFLLPLTCPAQVKGQDANVDSLKQKAMEHYYYDRDSAYFYFNKINEIAKRQNDLSLRIESLFNTTGVASYHYDLSQMGNTINALDTLLGSKRDSAKPVSKDEHNIFLYYLGDYQLKLFENSDSRKSFETILENIEKTPDSLVTDTMKSLSSAAYSFLGKIYMLEGKYDLATQLYRRNIREILNAETANAESLNGNYNLLAEVLTKQGSYAEANAHLLKAFRYHREQGNINSLITCAFNIAENYRHLSQKDSALFYLERAKTNFIGKPYFYPKYHIKKAAVHKADEDLDSALENLHTAIKIIHREFPDQRNADLPEAWNEIGEIHSLMDRPKKALTSFDKAFNQAQKNSKKNRYSLEILKNKAITLNRIGTENSYKSALEAVILGTQILDSLKPSFKSEGDKLFLVEDAYPIFETGVAAAYNLTRTEQNEDYIDQAFELMEKSKSVLLLEALLASKATDFTDIPAALLERESQLKSEITFIEKRINTANSDTGKLEDDLFDLKNQYRQLVNTLENSYETYYNLKYSTATVSLDDVQETLGEDEQLISYLYGDQALYAIGLTKTSKKMVKIAIDSLFEESLRDIYQMLIDPKSDLAALGKASHRLYRSILKPFAVSSKNRPRLTIIADGLLNYIPFGSLNTSVSGISYLAENYSTAYSSSATLNSQLTKREPKGSKVLAFAPSFDGTAEVDTDRSKLLPLPHNKEEVNKLMNNFDGRSYMDKEASLENFRKELGRFNVLHLATHAIFDDELPEYSYLAFAQNDGSNNDDVLFVADLYNLNTQADMVTLSACESGIGNLRRGEGFLSLARGFFYSGASSITSTLWKVNDASSAQLMDSFYKNLSEGDAKDLALQRAQLSFLDANRENGLSHPYYWSGFVVSGNTVPLLTNNFWMWVGLSAAILLAIAGFYYFRKKEISQSYRL